jgi:hypothetical protein
MPRLTAERLQKLEKDILDGEPFDKLKEQYDVSVPTLYNIRRRIKPTVPPTSPTASDLVQQALDQVDREIAELQAKIAAVENLKTALEEKLAFKESLKKALGSKQ